MSVSFNNNFQNVPFNDLKNSYDAGIQAHNEMIQQKSFLLTGHPIGDMGVKVDLKLLGLLDGDSFIRESPLEGITPIQSITHFVTFTNQLLKRADEEPET